MTTATIVRPTDAPEIEDKAEARSRFNHPIRTIEAAWKLGELDGHEIYVTLHCGHHGDRKAFYSTVHVKAVRDGVWGYAPFSGSSLGFERVARYSAKGLRAYAQAKIAEVQADFKAAAPTLAKHLAWPPADAGLLVR